MELQLRITEKWKEIYGVKRLEFRRGNILYKDAIVVIAQSKGKEEEIQIPYHAVAIKYVDGAQPKLTLYKCRKDGELINTSEKFKLRICEITNAEFELPKGYKIEGLEEQIGGLT